MKKLAIAVSLIAFFLYRPYIMQSSAMLYGGDDENYMAHATALVYGHFPDYTQEANSTFPPFHAMGSSILSVPFVFSFSVLDRLLDNPVMDRRTRDTLVQSWSAFGFVVATQTFFFLGIYWLFKTLSIAGGYALPAVLLNVIPSGIMLYAYRRPVFPHVYEFALIALLLYLLTNKLGNNKECNYKYMIFVGILSGFVYWSRINDGPIALAFILSFALLCSPRRSTSLVSCFKSRYFWARLAIGMIGFFCVFGITIWMGKIVEDSKEDIVLVGNQLYLNFATGRLGELKSLSFYLEAFLHFLFGLDWGLVYTAPFLLVGLYGLRYTINNSFLLIPAAALIVNFYIAIVFGSQGGWYGYRYVVFSALPFSTLGFSLLLTRITYKQRRNILVCLSLVALIPFMSMMSFEGNATVLTLHIGYTKWTRDWINNTYQYEIWKLLLYNPVEMLIAIFKGGPLYLLYLCAVVMEQTDALPSKVLEKYPIFSFTVLVKSFFIWFWPIFMGWTLDKFETRIWKNTVWSALWPSAKSIFNGNKKKG